MLGCLMIFNNYCKITYIFIYHQKATNGFLFTASSYAAMPVVFAKDDQEPKLVRPKDLSIYPEESKENKRQA